MIEHKRNMSQADTLRNKGASSPDQAAGIEVPLDAGRHSYMDLAGDPDAQGRYWREHVGLDQIKEIQKTNEKTGETYVQRVFKRSGRADNFMAVYDPRGGYEHFVPDVMASAADQGLTAEEARQKVLSTREQGGDWQTALEDNKETLFAEYKIHLQPKKEYIPVIVDRLIKLTDERPELKSLITAFKAKLGGSVKEGADGQTEQMPEIVVYPKLGTERDETGKTAGRNNMEMVLAAILDATRDLEGVANGQVPRENAKVSDLVFVAQGGGDLKNDLKSMGVIDQFMEKDADGRYSFRRGEHPPTAEELEAARGKLAAAAEARQARERQEHAAQEQHKLEQARNGLHQAFGVGAPRSAEAAPAALPPAAETAPAKTGWTTRLRNLFRRRKN